LYERRLEQRQPAGWRSSQGSSGGVETEQPGSGIAEIARRYEISPGLLWNWRSQVRRGELRAEPPPVFLPVRTISEPANGNGGTHVEPSSATGADPAASSDKIEITLPDGTSVKVGHDIGVVALRRVMSVLRPMIVPHSRMAGRVGRQLS
jgi:transposase